MEDELRRMAMAGASDDALQQFIAARRRRDTELANRLLTQFQTPSGPTHAPTPLQRLRVAALRPVVNSLEAQALYSYICILWPLSDQAVRTTVEPTCWENDSFVASIADSLMHVALEHLQAESVGPIGPHPEH